MIYKGIRILYEDNHLLVAVKPPNMLSQADSTGDPDILTLLKEYIKRKYNKPGNVYLGLVHRLDRPVGGVMVFCRTSKSASRLSAQMREGTVGKKYAAVVWDQPRPTHGRLRHYLYKDQKSNMVKVVNAAGHGAKEAILDYEVLDTTGQMSLIEVVLHTGRPHQIRVQMATAGHPLVGDQRYGRSGQPKQQIALWATYLSFSHPTRKEKMQFTVEPPDEVPWSEFGKA